MTNDIAKLRRLVLCITGASGSIYARRCLQILSDKAIGRVADLEVHWIASRNAPQVWQSELNEPMPSSFGPSCRNWDRFDFSAPFASGSNPADAVLVMPCSMSALARIAHGGGEDLISRSCDVALKERRRLILVVRETPLSKIHIHNMLKVTEAGAIVLPAVPSFYSGVTTLEQAIDTVVVRALDHCGCPLDLRPRWGS